MTNLGKLNYCQQFSREEYDAVYLELKSKYSKKLIDGWTECTDPHKFVHEDIGIASYLILLWKGQGPCNFVDLGCGNGLLVYILIEEGHNGLGLDVRRRKIWDTYPKTTVLEEKTIIPSSSSVYTEADWLIGNHSDELTAWLPIMAARSNPTCQFFTIPCCPYKLNGAKFQRRKCFLSVYQDFLEYIQEVGEVCGFDVSADKMRIPSTKRICLIGRRKFSNLADIDDAITCFIDTECPGGVGAINEGKMWINEYTPRVAVEPVRNCSRVSKDIQIEILQQVIAKLLSEVVPYELDDGRSWNRGAVYEISQIADEIDKDLLQKLKLQCKGLQTLFRNNHQIFEVKSGTVQFRSPGSLKSNSESVQRRNDFHWKLKNCWFHAKHPHGCPLSEAVCSYKHT